MAVMFGTDASVEVLLECGAKVESKNNNGDTALTLAAFNTRMYQVELLLNMHAHLEHRNRFGNTALLQVGYSR